MAIVSDVEIRLRADIARLQQDMTAARRSVDRGMDGITSAVNVAKKALGALGVGLGIKEIVMQVVNAQREFDKLNTSLVTATGSTSGAAAAFKALQAFAASTPFSVNEATEAFIKLQNLGLTPSERALNAYGNTASSMGKSLNQMIEAVADAATGEFERLKEFGIKAKQNGDQVMLTFRGVTKQIGNNAKDIESYLMKIGETEFAGAMERRANTLDGAISNLGDSWETMLRKVSSNGFGQGIMAGVLAFSGALSDLSAILDAVGGAAKKEGEQVREAAGLHKAITTVFETVAVLGVNVAYVFTQVGKELGGLAAQAAAVARGDFAGAKAIGESMKAEAAAARKAVDEKSAAILGASQKAQDAQAKEAAARKAAGVDTLEGFKKELSAEEKRNQAKLAIIDIANKLNGVDNDTINNLKKLKTALDTGAISQAEYNRYVAQTNLEATKNSTAYKNQVKALDISSAAIKRNADAQAFANQQAIQNIEFLNRTGQLNDVDALMQRNALEIKGLDNAKAALEAQLEVEKKRVDNKAKILELVDQIALAERAAAAGRTKAEQALFELEQKQYREAVNATADRIEAAQEEVRTQQQATLAMQDEIDALGLTSKQLAEVTAARLRDRAAALERRADIGIIDEETEALRRQAAELRKQADLGLTRERVEEQKKFWSDVDQVAHDTFVSIADGGKDLGTRLKDTLKNTFFDWLYKMTLKKWIINLQTSTSGGFTSLFNAQDSSSLFDAGKTILQGFSKNLSATLGGAISKLGEAFGSTAATSFGSSISSSSSAGGIAGAVIAGMMANNAFYDQGWKIDGQVGDIIKSQLQSMFKGNFLAPITAVMTASMASFEKLLGRIGVNGKLASMLSGSAVFARAFGHKAPEIEAQGISGTISSSGFSGGAFANILEKGGWFRSDKRYTKTVDLASEQQTAFNTTIGGIVDSIRAFSDVLGAQSSAIDGYSKQVSVTLGKDEAENEKLINAMFAGIGDDLAQRVLPNIAKFQQAGETTSATLQRLAVDFTAVDAVLTSMGVDSQTAFGAVGTASIDAREQLVKLAGGIDALVQQSQFFNENFLTQAEKVAPIQKEVTEKLAALGFAGLTTVEQFKDAVQGLLKSGAVASEEGAKQYAGLLALAPKFKTVTDYLKEVSDAAEQTAKDLADAKAKMLAESLQNNAQLLGTVVGDALSAVGRAVDAQKDRLTAAFEKTMAALDADISRVNDTISRTGELSKALKDALVAQPGENGAGREQAGRAEITAALAIAKASGVLPTPESLAAAIAAVGQDNTDNYTTLAEYQRAVARTNNELEALGGLTDDQLDTAERQLQLMQAQKDAAQVQHDAELAALDRIAAQAQAEVDAINGANGSVLSVERAVLALQAALGALKTGATPTNPNGSAFTVEDLYRTILGRAPDAAGYAFWKQAYGDSVDQAEYLDFLKAAQPELQGLVQAPPNVATASGTMSSSNAMLSELQILNSRIANVEVAVSNTATNTGQFAQQFHQVSGGGNALATEAV
jgi:hypothetical protein